MRNFSAREEGGTLPTLWCLFHRPEKLIYLLPIFPLLL
jgi:hypothetical protein